MAEVRLKPLGEISKTVVGMLSDHRVAGLVRTCAVRNPIDGNTNIARQLQSVLLTNDNAQTTRLRFAI